MAFVKLVVDRLDNLEDCISPVLFELGTRHTCKADLSEHNISLFIDSLLYVWSSILNDKMTPECTAAWRTVFSYIMARLHQGFTSGH